MFKKLLIASALVLSAVAVTAAETDKPEAKKPAAKKTPDIIQISINLSGDNDATFEVVENSKNVRPNAKVAPFRNKKPGRSLGFRIPAAATLTYRAVRIRLARLGSRPKLSWMYQPSRFHRYESGRPMSEMTENERYGSA